ncbi:integrase catalytic domain-containing protein [Trichonephila clavipes]|nr:integrase catalytic domain-containing protein [Trichonephila clavipes]
MKSAFNQIPLHFADRHKTAFSTPDGDKYEFNRLCFGLKNSPKAFQSIAQEVLGDLLHNGALVYIDDVILFTKTIDEHFELLGFLSNKIFSSKILRWKLALEEFNYDIHYIRGSLNSVADHLSRCINNITIALPESKDLIKMQHEDPVLSPIIQKIDQNDVSLQVYPEKRFQNSPAPHQPVEQKSEPGETCHIDIFGPLKTTPKEHGRDIRLSYTYEKSSDTPQNKYEYVEKLLPSLELIFNKVLKNLKEQEASHVDLSTRATKQHHYDYKIGSLCFIKTPNIKSNLSPKLRSKFEGPYRVIELFSNVNYRVQHVEQ